MNSMLEQLCKQVAPSYNFQPLLAHLRDKFSLLSEQEFSLRLAECLKFLYLRSLTGRGFIPLAGEVDDVWHEIILQTREYAKLCQALPGGSFIHHNSISLEDHAEQISNQQAVKNLLEWIPSYVNHFGDFTAQTAKYWVMIKLLECEFGYTLEDINQLS
jgi:hypothetical protein